MSPSKILAILAACALAFTASAHAADHWYQITIQAGDSSMEFTGTSALESAQLAKQVTGTEPITLENLREYNQPEDNPSGAWVAVATATKLYIVPKTVLFFYELTGDPMTTPAAATPAAAAHEPAAPAAQPEPAKEKAAKGKKK